MSKPISTIWQSISAKSERQWQVLLGLWSLTGLIALVAPWNLGLAASLFALFLHLAATEE
jgi:hypothetical protein